MSALHVGRTGRMGDIAREQRYLDGRTCPICGGRELDQRGKGARCYGYVSQDGEYVHCTREEYAGALAVNGNTSTYAHRRRGTCKCGVTHAPAPVSYPARSATRQQTRSQARQGATAAGSSERTPATRRASGASVSEPSGASGNASSVKGRGARRVGNAPEAVYPYTLADGTPRYKVERWRTVDTDTGEIGKTFTPYRADTTAPGGWHTRAGMGDTPHLIYRAHELATAPADKWVYIPEGEKCADRLAAVGMLATCNDGGAMKWRRCADVARAALAGRHVVILPDNDGESAHKPHTSYVGQRHALDVAASLADVAASVRVILLPGLAPKGDVYDWLEAGHTSGELEALATAAPCYDPTAPAIWRPTEDTPGAGGTSGAWWSMPTQTTPDATPATGVPFERIRADGMTEDTPTEDTPATPDGEGAPFGELLAVIGRGELRYVGETPDTGEAPGVYFVSISTRGERRVCLFSAPLEVSAVDASEARGRRSQVAVTLHLSGAPAPIRRIWTREEVTGGEAFDALLGAVEIMPSGRSEYDMMWKALAALAARASSERPTIRRRYVERLGWHAGVWVSVNGAIDASGAHLDAGIVAGAPDTWPQRLPATLDTLPDTVGADVLRRLLSFWPANVTRFPYAAIGACSAVMHPASGGRLRWELELFGNSDWMKTAFINWTLRAFFGAGYTYGTGTQLGTIDTGLGRSLTRAMLAYHAYLDYDYSQKPGQPKHEPQQEARIASLMASGNEDTGGAKSSRDGRLEMRPDPQGLLIRAGEPNPYLYSVRQGAWSADARGVTYLLTGNPKPTRDERLAASQWLATQTGALDRLAILYRQWLASFTEDASRAQWSAARREALAIVASVADRLEDGAGELHTRLILEQLPDILAGCLLYSAFLAAVDADTGSYARVVIGGATLAQEIRATLEAIASERIQAMQALRLEYTRQQGGVTPENALATAIHDAIREALARGEYYLTTPDGGAPTVAGISLAAMGYGAYTFQEGYGADVKTVQSWRARPNARPLAFLSGDGERLACDRHMLEVLLREASQHDRRISFTTLASVLERLRAVGAIVTSPGRLTHQERIPGKSAPDRTRIAFCVGDIWPDMDIGEGEDGETSETGQSGADSSPDPLEDATPASDTGNTGNTGEPDGAPFEPFEPFEPYAPDTLTYDGDTYDTGAGWGAGDEPGEGGADPHADGADGIGWISEYDKPGGREKLEDATGEQWVRDEV